SVVFASACIAIVERSAKLGLQSLGNYSMILMSECMVWRPTRWRQRFVTGPILILAVIFLSCLGSGIYAHFCRPPTRLVIRTFEDLQQHPDIAIYVVPFLGHEDFLQSNYPDLAKRITDKHIMDNVRIINVILHPRKGEELYLEYMSRQKHCVFIQDAEITLTSEAMFRRAQALNGHTLNESFELMPMETDYASVLLYPWIPKGTDYAQYIVPAMDKAYVPL